MPQETFAQLAAGDSFTFVRGGPRFDKVDASTYRTAGGGNPILCDNIARPVFDVARVSVSTPRELERARMIRAIKGALAHLNDGDPNAARRILMAELTNQERKSHGPA